jgi:hypothetical protein
MRWWSTASLLAMALVVSSDGCQDDEVSASGGGTEGTGATTGPDSGADETHGPDADDGGSCQPDCDDGDPCTLDTCEPDGMCTHAPVPLDNTCRPAIDVSFPARAQTVLGRTGQPVVTVTGNVHSGMAAITSLTVNGADVAFDAAGEFQHDVAVTTGGNLLVLETTDAAGNAQRRVQSFNWSTTYDHPTTAPDGIAPVGLGFFLGQDSIDDGVPAPPTDDLAAILQLVLASFDVAALFDAKTVIASQAGYDIYLTDLVLGGSDLSLTAIDGGIRIDATLSDIDGDLQFDCTNFGCQLTGGDSSGGLSISTVQMQADLAMTVLPDHTLAAQLMDVTVSVDPNDVNVWSNNGWTNFLLSIVEVFILDGLVGDLEAQLQTAVSDQLGPALAGGFSQLTLATSFEFPNLGDARSPIVVDLFADFADTDFHDGVAPPRPSPPAGGLVTLRGGGYAAAVESPFDNLGVPRRDECGTGTTQLRMPRAAPLEIGLTDDLLNQLLFAGWRGGLLEFPLASDRLAGGFVEDFSVEVSGWSAPTASDCDADGRLRVMIGDIQIDAELTLLGAPVTFTAYTSLVAAVTIAQTRDGVSIEFDEIERVETELTADDDSIMVEALLIRSLEGELIGGLLGQLGGLGAISLPEIDLSGLLGLPPGSAPLTIAVQGTSREPGTTVIAAELQ